MTKKIAVIITLAVILVASLPLSAAMATTKGPIPGINIVSVVPGTVVTVETLNFPPNLDFDVIIGPYGQYGLTGFKVATTNSGKGGTFTVTYNIPPEYKKAALLAIRLFNPTKGYYAYNWFENVIPPAPPVKPVTTIPGYTGLPSFTIKEVEADKSVTVEARNFPPDADLEVLMNVISTRGKFGFKAGTINAGDEGEFRAKFNIPAELVGAYMISIRVQDPNSGYYGYNWFFNKTYPVVQPVIPTPVPATGASPVYPTVEITAVEKSVKVTIQAANLPKNETFDVYMGNLNSMAWGGMQVSTLESGDTGSATATLDIPAALAGLWQISIRIVSQTSGYYGYNWFYNQTYP